jgi:hypothetical protein
VIKLILAENSGGRTSSCILLPPPVNCHGRSVVSGAVTGWIVVTYLEVQILKEEIELNWLVKSAAAVMTIMNV